MIYVSVKMPSPIGIIRLYICTYMYVERNPVHRAQEGVARTRTHMLGVDMRRGG